MLAIRQLGKSFPDRQLFANVDLDLHPGEIVAIMGESGSGKSTLLNLIAGLDTADHGTITLEGRELTALDDDARTLVRRSRMGFVFQAFHVLPFLTVEANVALPLALNGVPIAERSPRAESALAFVGLAARRNSSPRVLSGGELQRVAIARAIVHAPQLLLADEPTGNLDPETAAQVLSLLRARVDQSAMATLLVTHSSTAAAIANRVYVLGRDGLTARGTR